MLSTVEKKEMLQDARSARRKDAFRKTNALDPLPSFDAYLEFLNSVNKTFATTPPAINPSRGCFKL